MAVPGCRVHRKTIADQVSGNVRLIPGFKTQKAGILLGILPGLLILDLWTGQANRVLPLASKGR